MALNLTSSYAGEKAAGFLSRAVFSSNLLEQVNLELNTKYKRVYQKYADSGNLIQYGSTCSISPQGDVIITETVLEPVKFFMAVDLCIDTLLKDWSSAQMRPGALNSNIPFESFLFEKMAETIRISLDRVTMVGNTAGATGTFMDAINGWLTQLFNADLPGTSGGVNEPVTVNSVGNLTASNIVAQLGEAYGVIPAAVAQAGDLKAVMNAQEARIYKLALANAYKNDSTQDFPDRFIDLDIVPHAFIPRGTFFVARMENMLAATDLLSDTNNIRTIDNREITGSSSIRFVAQWTFAVGWGFIPEVVYYRPAK